jgi:flagellar biosynthesis chaperone FliJ
MSNKTKKITNYLRSAVAAQVNRCIEFKEDNYFYFPLEHLMQGTIDKNIFIEFSRDSKSDETIEFIDVILVGKTVRTIFDSQEKMSSDFEDLTGIYYIPAKLNKEGLLFYNQNKLPWIPRIFLYPMVEPKLSIGKKDEYDQFMSDNIGRIHKIKSWNDYITFVKDLYEGVTGNDFMSNTINDTELEKQVYIIKDDTINAIRPILDLYEDLLKENLTTKLYENFIDIESKVKKPLINNSIENMKKHYGQMGGKHYLSKSQRECINHFNHMVEGEILAVNGPPGTGKTKMLQSVVASMYVECALRKEKAPLIVASSTNNQAVTNIIESFGDIDKQGLENLEQRWIVGVDSFAVYFPSLSKEEEAYKKGYQYTDQRGKNFISSVESEENIQASEKKMIKSCNEYFKTNINNIEQCEEILHKTLLDIDKIREKLLILSNQIEKLQIGDRTLNKFIDDLEDEIEIIRDDIDSKSKRVEEWLQHFKEMPIWFKLFKFLKCIKRRIYTKNRLFIQTDEEDFISENMTFVDIEEKYSYLIKDLRKKRSDLDRLYNKAKGIQLEYNKYNDTLEKLNVGIKDRMDESNTNLNDMNNLMDQTLRYIEFWLSVHYYECRWIKGEDQLTDNQKGTNYKNVLERLFNRLSMITPCYVMTFYQLPKVFKYYIKDKGDGFLYKHIDLLIVDEAGQVSPEIAACSFSLAIKALIVGDTHQIEPVWSVNSSLDTALAMEHKVINNKLEFEKLDNYGLNASSSSVMKVASARCNYKKYENGGLFLSEHRRCYNEIISYCNDLVYEGHLEPMRGLGALDSNYTLKDIPHMGYMQIDTERSSKSGGSRYNLNEIQAIAMWINQNFERIKLAYPDKDEKNLIGIITPFKAQETLMKKEFMKLLPFDIRKYISYGTVHTFQGAERQIVIMSTVYGRLDGCYFIDIKKSMLNVAVSRAKDSFLVFGDINCLDKSKQSASGLLRSYIENNKI